MGDVSVSGFGELDRKLARLERGDPDAIPPALMAGARVIGDEQRRLVPKRSGNLHGSIVETMIPANLPADGMTVYIGQTIGKQAEHDGWYGYIVETGHENAAPHPFARPAVDLKGEEALGLVMSRLAARYMDLAA